MQAHEGEHVSNAYTKAAQNNGTVVNASVSIHTSVCPECGRTYVSGGTTNTTIRYNESNPYGQNQKSLDAASLIGGQGGSECLMQAVLIEKLEKKWSNIDGHQ